MGLCRYSVSRSRAIAYFHDSLRPGPDHVDNRTVVVNLLENGPYGLQFDETPAAELILHLLQFVVERELLVAVIVGETPSELQRRCKALKQRRQLLD